jgi:alpha-beta hydrolase superfamily lysophospholipase
MSNKADDSIIVFAEETAAKGYQVLSSDLSEHGERKDKCYLCKVQNCVKDLSIIMNYAKSMWSNISIFACSMGA